MTSDPYQSVITLIRDAMTRSGSSQSELARVLGVSPSAVSEWLAGRRRPGIQHLERIARLAGVNPGAALRDFGYLIGHYGAELPPATSTREAVMLRVQAAIAELSEADLEIVELLASAMAGRTRPRRKRAGRIDRAVE